MAEEFHLTFLGTEACDMDWSRYGEPGIYGSTQTLVNGRVLIDAGQTGYRSLGRFHVDPTALEELWFTHYHSDHCFPAEIAQIVQPAAQDDQGQQGTRNIAGRDHTALAQRPPRRGP